MNDYKLEKNIWTHADFEIMGWHDCVIYVIRFDSNLEFDIDYIFKWVNPVDDEKFNKFWISPATLIFENVENLKIEIDLQFINGIEIFEIKREKSLHDKFKWAIETQEGNIEFISSGYKQYTKKSPVLKTNQCLSQEERGGYNFNTS